MMIDPITYMEMHIKDTYEELLQEKKDLKGYISDYENGRLPESVIVSPSPEVIYKMNKTYLKRVDMLINEKLALQSEIVKITRTNKGCFFDFKNVTSIDIKTGRIRVSEYERKPWVKVAESWRLHSEDALKSIFTDVKKVLEEGYSYRDAPIDDCIHTIEIAFENKKKIKIFGEDKRYQAIRDILRNYISDEDE